MLLTIIIPTYNRAMQLEKNLDCILPQAKHHKELVNVYVSDNASTDYTNETMSRYLAEYPDVLSYFRQPSNIGSNPNFFHAINNVASRYVCLLGDDDYVRPDYLDTVIGLIEKYPTAGLINYNMLSVTDTNIISGVRDTIAYDNHIGYYETGGDFFKKHLHAPSQMSSNVFLRDAFLEASKQIETNEYPGYGWYMTMALSVINKPCVYYDFPLVCATAPSVVRWIADAPWYHIYGLGHMFRELDKYCKGMETAWREGYQKDRLLYDFLLQIISQNRLIYKDRKKSLLEFAPNEKYARKVKLYINYPNWLVLHMVRAGKIVRKFARILHIA